MCLFFDVDGKFISLVELYNGMFFVMKEFLVMVSCWLLLVYRVIIYGVFCFYMFFVLFQIIEFDVFKKKVDIEGIINRGDGVRYL